MRKLLSVTSALRMLRPTLLLSALLLPAFVLPMLLSPPAYAAGYWPVGDHPAVVRPWAPPASPYGPGHRGVDLAAPIGAPVRTIADGRVSFTGEVAGRGVVSVTLSGTGDPPLRTTYEPVTASVDRGQKVAAGTVIGTLQLPTGHCPRPSPSCLHWGLLKGDTYLDPLSLLDPSLLRPTPARLLPLWGPDPLWAPLWGRVRLRGQDLPDLSDPSERSGEAL